MKLLSLYAKLCIFSLMVTLLGSAVWAQEAPGTAQPKEKAGAQSAAKTEATAAAQSTKAKDPREAAAGEALKKPILNEGVAPSRLGEVVVSATRTEQQKRDVAGSVSSYDKNDQQMVLASDYRDLVSEELDVSTVGNVGGQGPAGHSGNGLQSYNIRGIDGNRVLMQTDGIRQPDQYTFGGTYSIGRNYQDLESLKRVEILKGSASSLYGSDAIGGVVTYLTKDPADFLDGKPQPWYAGFKTSFDSANLEFAETLTGAVRSGPVDLLAVYTYRHGEEADNKGNIRSNPLSFEGQNVLAKAVWQANEFNRFTLTAEYFHRDLDAFLANRVGIFLVDPMFGPQLNQSSVTQDTTIDRARVSIGHRFERPDATPLFDSFSWQGYYQPSEQTEGIEEHYTRQSTFPFPGAVVPYRRVFDRSFSNDIAGGTFQFEKRFEAADWTHRLIYGADISAAHLERNVDGFIQNLITNVVSKSFGTAPNPGGPYLMPYKEIPDSDVFRLGLYVQDQIDYGAQQAFSIVPGLRLDYYDLSVDNDLLYTKVVGTSGTGFREWSLSPKLAMIGRPADNWTVYGQFAQGFRSPTTEELNAVFNNPSSFYQVIGNPNLKSETSYNFEVGVRTELPWVQMSLAGYYNYYQNFINQQTFVGFGPGGIQVFQSTNIDQAEIFGATLTTEWPLGIYREDLEGLSFLFGFAVAQGNDLQNGQPLDSVDPWKLRTGLRYRRDNWGVDLIHTYVGAKSRVSNNVVNQFHTPEFNTVDVVGHYKINEHATISLGIYNLTDEKYWMWQDVRGINNVGNAPTGLGNQIDLFTQPGINFRTSVTISF